MVDRGNLNNNNNKKYGKQRFMVRNYSGNGVIQKYGNQRSREVTIMSSFK